MEETVSTLSLVKIFIGGEFNIKKYIYFLFFIYVIVISFFSKFTYNMVSEDIKDQIGTKAMLLAIDISNRTEISFEAFNTIKKSDYDSVKSYPPYVKFGIISKHVIEESRHIDTSKIRYIFLEVPLRPDEVKYVVEKDDKRYFLEELGTKLNAMYLLDSQPFTNTRYSDRDRYEIMYDNFKEAYNSKKPTYCFNNDKWGEYFTGYAPFYTTEGHYIGLIGVDLDLSSYNEYLGSILNLILTFTISSIFLGIYAIYLIFKFCDIKEKAIIEKVNSSTDTLSNLLNRMSFMKLFNAIWLKCLDENRSLSLLIIDVDYFKEYNDNYGHLKGDEIIISIANILKESVNSSSDIIGRYGGDEFLILFEDLSFSKLQSISKDILKRLKSLNLEHSYSPKNRVTISIGGASIVPTYNYEKEDLIKLSDKALYNAKHLGKDCHYIEKF